MNPTDGATHNVSPITGSEVTALIEEGNALEERGCIAEAMARYDAAVRADPRCARGHLNRGNVLLADGKIDEARNAYEFALACDPQYAAGHYNLGNLNYRLGEYGSALKNYQAAVAVRADFASAFVAMGNALDALGRTAEAMESYQSALVLNPDYAEVHFNLGVLAMNEGRREEAAGSLRNAIHIHPSYAEAHHVLGRVLTRLGDFDAAEASLRRALSCAPESEVILDNLAGFLVMRGKFPDAVQLILPYLTRSPTPTIKRAFINCVARTTFVTSDSATRAALVVALTEPWADPNELSRSAIKLLMLDAGIATLVRRVNERCAAGGHKPWLLAPEDIAALVADPLLKALLETAPVSTPEFERFLTAARYSLIETASSQISDCSDSASVQFYASLAQQCFINEYIFDCEGQEHATAVVCRQKVVALLDADAGIPPLLLIAVAAYFPLYELPEASRLLSAEQQGPVADLIRQQVQEPLEERKLRAKVECLTPITRGVSEKVRGHYEQNPYPRWVRLPIETSPLRFNEEMQRTLPLARIAPLPDDSAPEMLIAGCGTGSQSIFTARRYRGVRILAVDLSLNSICYAIRKTQELGVSNVEYAQADIVQLGQIERSFDIIAAVGVLHHLADPFEGWRTLLSLLRPGGFMQLGFYSQLARRHIVKAREWISARGYSSSAEDIRRFRRDLALLNKGAELRWLSQIPDFYSTSECRDLLFHVQEHQLTLDQLESFISGHGLRFLGFELHPTVLHAYRTRFADDPAGIALRNWSRFEADHPDTFVGMYHFWIQMPGASDGRSQPPQMNNL